MTQTTDTNALLAAIVAQVEKENDEHVEEPVTGPVTPFPTIV